MSRRFEGAHDISVHELKGCINDGEVGFLGVSQLMTFPHRTDVAVRNRTVKCDSNAALSVRELQATLIDVAQPPVPHLGIDHRIHRQLLSCVTIRTEV